MVLIARALIKGPGLLIMDEPESNLDMKNQLIVLNTIERLAASNLAVVINTHYPEHALRCAHKTLLMGKEGYLFWGYERGLPKTISESILRSIHRLSR